MRITSLSILILTSISVSAAEPKKPAAERRDTLPELVVTAREGDGLSSSSRIDRDAMNHLQPSSFADLLELLPGNISTTPDMGKMNAITLRETGNLSATGAKTQNDDYAISSLGTLFMVDGSPINGDANLNSIGTASDAAGDARTLTNRGTDMRSLSTDNIQSVEIIRGIPSAEYGNLTSGVVKITRINRSTPLSFRFKADEYSKLFSIAKGFGVGKTPWVINADLGYLDSKTDPRNNLENYKRLTGSLRTTWRKTADLARYNLNIGADYTGSFDNAKVDPDLNYNKVDEYKSTYNRISFNSDFSMELSEHAWFTDFGANFSASYQIDRLKRRKQVAPQRASIAPTTTAPGEHNGEYLLSEYIADYESDGRPFNTFLKARAAGERMTGTVTNKYKVGLEWTYSKNFGKGQVYDLRRPLSAGWTTRPRAFRDIPGLNVLSLFLEDQMEWMIGAHQLSVQAGVRGIMLPGLGKAYHLNGRPYLDPRLNAAFDLYAGRIGKKPLTLTIAGGYGLTTKMPTIDYLFPQSHYNDIIQLNHYNTENPENSIINIMTYIEDATNYDLRPARNHKWELRLGAEWNGFRASVTYFQEKMNDGFRYETVYSSYDYKKYSTEGLEGLDGLNGLDDLKFSNEKILDGYRKATNGTRIWKQGVEWTLSTPRWNALRTALTVTGAWFKSTYSNSQMKYETVNDVVGGLVISDRYVGLYDYLDGRVNEQVNTNFMFDTQIPRWGLVFTTTLQCMWSVKSTRLPINGVPLFYLDAMDGELHPYLEEMEGDPVLQFLVRHYNQDTFRPVRIPFAGYLNLKATKQIGKHVRIALFVNRILDWLPSYYSNGLLVRRSANPYFGMEVNLRF